MPIVGGKNAALGEMYSTLTSEGVEVPNDFSMTAEAYRYFLRGQKMDALARAPWSMALRERISLR